MDKVNANSETKCILSAKINVKRALFDIVNSIPPQAAGGKPAVKIARLINDTAQQQGTPFTLNGDSVCILIDGRRNTLSKDVINWLIEATATKLRIKSMPMCEAVAKAYYLQFVHTTRKDYFTNNKAA